LIIAAGLGASSVPGLRARDFAPKRAVRVARCGRSFRVDGRRVPRARAALRALFGAAVVSDDLGVVRTMKIVRYAEPGRQR